MSGHVRAFLAILFLGILAIAGVRFLLPIWQKAKQLETSDAASEHGSLVVGVDSWVGYFPLCSPAMETRMRDAGYNLRCEDDQADYATRFARLKNDELQLAVATVDSYVLNGLQTQYPGTIIAVIDQSKGGDAIVARRSVAVNLDGLKKRAAVRVAFTPNSPSEHFLKAVGVHFDVPHFKDRHGSWRVIANGSSDALAKLQRGEADVAVLWEPDVSRALANGDFVKLIGTENTDNLIIDVLIASRKLVQEKPEAINVLLNNYFHSLSQYRQDEALLRNQLRAYSKVDVAQVDAMLNGVDWASLDDNGLHWWGVSGTPIGERNLVTAINDTTQVLIAAGDFYKSPLPDNDPNRLINSQFISALYKSQFGSAGDVAKSLQKTFAPLDDKGWARLQEVGTLKVEPISFQRGTATLGEDAEGVIGRMAERLRAFPNYRILIKGHTGLGGDAAANMELSKSRAQSVAIYLLTTFTIDANRIRAVGYGASQPLPRLEGELDRTYGYRLPRVEVTLLTEPY